MKNGKKVGFIRNLVNKIYMAAQTGTLEYDSLATGQAVTVGGEIAPDGEYTVTVDEVEKEVSVKDGVIDSITDKEVEMEKEPEKVVESVVVTVAETELSEDEKIKLAEMEKEKLLNIEGLKALFSDNMNGYGSISFDFVDGVMVWGDVYASEYKTLLSSDIDAKDQEIVKLKEDIVKKEATITALSKESVKSELIQAPVESHVEAKPLSISQELIQAYKR